jgi:hypothetical protein
MTLSHYLQGLLTHFTDARIVRNITTLMQQMVEHTTIRLWSLATEKAEFVRHKRLVNGSLQAVLDEALVADALREIGSRELAQAPEDTTLLVLLHDPCDIRKPYAAELECLGTVRALDGRPVPGYQTFNTVVLDEHGHTPQPLDVTVYSNGDPHYVTEDELALEQRVQTTSSATSPLSPERLGEIRQFLKEDSYINLYRVTSAQLTRVSRHLQHQTPRRPRCHIMDRQFDGGRYVRLIDQELHDFFVLRLKSSRTIPGLKVAGSVSVQDVPCPDMAAYPISTIRLHHHTYQNVTCYVEWRPFELDGQVYTMVRITLVDRHHHLIFDDPMILLTNLPVTGREDACRVYHLYLLRAKIEGVFRFCKTVLGWEEAQVRDYASIRRLLALAFYLAGFFYASDSTVIDNPVIALICQLGGGKGTVTRYFFLKGLQFLLIYRRVLTFQRMMPQGVQFEALLAFLE